MERSLSYSDSKNADLPLLPEDEEALLTKRALSTGGESSSALPVDAGAEVEGDVAGGYGLLSGNELRQARDGDGLPTGEVVGEGGDLAVKEEIVLASEVERVNQTDFCEPRGGPGPASLKGRARFEAWLESLVSRSRFLHKFLSMIYLPLAFHSGIRMKKVDANTFTYVLPFRRFNKNWYKAMAGAALVANSEIAAGLYLMGELKGRWTVICRHLNYRFLRPCFGPAIYKITALQDMSALMEEGKEFNIDLVIDIIQQVSNPRKKPPKVGRCNITFHVTPKDPDGNYKLLRRHLHRSRKKNQELA